MEAPTNVQPRLEYRVNFSQTGTYYVWVRGWGPTGTSDSAFFGFDGGWLANRVNLSPLNSWVWKGPFTMNIGNAGVHTLGITKRESLAQVDKIFVGTSATATPTGTGPPESSRGGSSNAPPVVNITAPSEGASFTAPASIAMPSTSRLTEIEMLSREHRGGRFASKAHLSALSAGAEVAQWSSRAVTSIELEWQTALNASAAGRTVRCWVTKSTSTRPKRAPRPSTHS